MSIREALILDFLFVYFKEIQGEHSVFVIFFAGFNYIKEADYIVYV